MEVVALMREGGGVWLEEGLRRSGMFHCRESDCDPSLYQGVTTERHSRHNHTWILGKSRYRTRGPLVVGRGSKAVKHSDASSSK